MDFKPQEGVRIKPIMKRERKFYVKIILAVYFTWFIFFEAVGRYASVLPMRDFTSYVDRQIPFIPEFVWPYVLCYGEEAVDNQ